MSRLLRRPRCARLPVAAASAVMLLAPASLALADQPVIEMPARFTGASSGGGSIVPDREPNFAAVRGYPSAGARAGHWGQLTYCTPYGPGTAIVGYLYLLGRWHTSQGDGLVVLENTDAGTRQQWTDGEIVQGSAQGRGAWEGTGAAMPPTGCIGVQVVARREMTSGTLTYTADLQRVRILDSGGPWVGAAHVAPGWVTGDAVTVEWDQGDNAFNRGTTGALVPGGGQTSLGDAPDGHVVAAVPVGGLPDGSHEVQVQRSAPGWDTRTMTVRFDLDRSDPATPDLDVETEAWTNADGVQVGAGASSDSGSGWLRNEFQVDGGGWTDLGARWTLRAPGVHEVRVRAVDRAGRRSAPSAPRSVRIDRTPPSIAPLEVDASAAAGPRVRLAVRDQGGAGVGDCRTTIAVDPVAGGGALTLVDLPARSLASVAEVDVPMRTFAAGEYELRIETCDAAGNRTARTATFTWHGPATTGAAPGGGGGTAAAVTPGGTVPAPPSTSRTVVAPGGRRLTLVGPVRVLVRRGRTAVLRGRLLQDGRPAVAGTRATVITPWGLAVAGGRVAPDGRLTIRFRPTRSGRWSVRVAGWAQAIPLPVAVVAPKAAVR